MLVNVLALAVLIIAWAAINMMMLRLKIGLEHTVAIRCRARLVSTCPGIRRSLSAILQLGILRATTWPSEMSSHDIGSIAMHGDALHLADSTLFYVLLHEYERAVPRCNRPIAIDPYETFADPTQRITVPGQLFFELCRSLYHRWGPDHVFRALSNAFVNQWTPISVVFNTAHDVSSIGRRLQAFEGLAGRSCVSEINCIDDRSVEVRCVPVRDLARAPSQRLAYWSYIVSVYKAAGCQGIRLETHAFVLFAQDHLNVPMFVCMADSERARLSWERRQEPVASRTPRICVAANARLIADLADHIRTSMAFRNQVRLRQVARAVHRSERTLQRRLRESNISFVRLRLALQLFAASRLLNGNEQNLAAIASAVGFSDAPHLVHRFQKATGLSPREFSRRLLV